METFRIDHNPDYTAAFRQAMRKRHRPTFSWALGGWKCRCGSTWHDCLARRREIEDTTEVILARRG